MEIKLFELRDRGTFIPAIAIKPRPRREAERFLLAKAGYGLATEEQSEYVLLGNLNGGDNPLRCDPYSWGPSRTMQVAHEYITQRWEQLTSGEVVDVEHILGETDKPKRSELEGAGA